MTSLEVIENIRQEVFELARINKKIAIDKKNPFINGIAAGYAEVLCYLDKLEIELKKGE